MQAQSLYSNCGKPALLIASQATKHLEYHSKWFMGRSVLVTSELEGGIHTVCE